MGENIRFLFDIVDYTNELDIPDSLFFADIEKAFDTSELDVVEEAERKLRHGLSARAQLFKS